MTWFKIDDGFWSHPKVLELSDAAVALWVRAGSYCAGHLTNGTVKKSTLRVLGADRDASVELVMAGLWDESPEGWTFHDWDDYQPTREAVLAERAAATERKRLSRERSRQKSQGESLRDVQRNDGVSPPSPTRPDPTRPDLPMENPPGSQVAEVRTDINLILDLLDAEVERNGSKKPARTKANLDAARMLLDKDGRTVEQVSAAIRWSQSDPFWRANILSMAKLRDKYDQLRLAAQRPAQTGSSRPSKDDQARDILAMGARLHKQQEIEQ